MEEAYELQNYLPLSFKSKSESDYIAFLWDTYDANYQAGKYQFAFLAYHMLTMAVIYFNIWQIRHTRGEQFEMAMVGFNKDMEADLLGATTPFAFHLVQESTVVRFMKLIGCDNAKCGNYAKLVKDRNGIAHCNGNIYPTDEASLRLKINEVLRIVEEIQEHSRPVVQECYQAFLLAGTDPEERVYIDSTDHVREELVYRNYFSAKDVEEALDLDVSSLGVDTERAEILALHEALRTLADVSGAAAETPPNVVGPEFTRVAAAAEQEIAALTALPPDGPQPPAPNAEPPPESKGQA